MFCTIEISSNKIEHIVSEIFKNIVSENNIGFELNNDYGLFIQHEDIDEENEIFIELNKIGSDSGWIPIDCNTCRKNIKDIKRTILQLINIQ